MTKVYIVQAHNNKDMSDARRHGELHVLYPSHIHRPYDTDHLTNVAHTQLRDFCEDDFLLLLGDPAICGMVTKVASEYSEIVRMLSWNRIKQEYHEVTWDFADAE